MGKQVYDGHDVVVSSDGLDGNGPSDSSPRWTSSGDQRSRHVDPDRTVPPLRVWSVFTSELLALPVSPFYGLGFREIRLRRARFVVRELKKKNHGENNGPEEGFRILSGLGKIKVSKESMYKNQSSIMYKL